MATSVAQLESLGYDVTTAIEGWTDDDHNVPSVLQVSGFGISLMVNEDDTETLDRLCNAKAHDSRVLQDESSVSADPVDLEAQVKADIDAKLALGDITQDEANAELAAWQRSQVPAPTAADMFSEAADAVAKASSLEDIKAAFATLKQNIAPFVTAK